jgi:hypothetical protein
VKESFTSYVLLLAALLLSTIVSVAGIVDARTVAGHVYCLVGATGSLTLALLIIWCRHRTTTEV